METVESCDTVRERGLEVVEEEVVWGMVVVEEWLPEVAAEDEE